MGRMERYEDENEDYILDENNLSRTHKNQELYTDVYLNNVYVDINNLEEVMNNDEDSSDSIRKGLDKKEYDNYTYEEKNYDIKEIVSITLTNKKEDNIKRSLDDSVSFFEIDNLVESISVQNKKIENKDSILTDLMPTEENTELIPALTEPILESMSYDETNSSVDNEDDDKVFKTAEMTSNDFIDSLKEENNKIKVIVTIVVIVIMLIIIGVIIWQKIIK